MNEIGIQTETAAGLGPDAAPAGTIAQTLARFAADTRFEDIPADIRQRAKYLILDAVGIAFASTREDFAHKSLSGVSSLAGIGPVPVIGMPSRLPARDAAIMNGILIHGLDYDDTHGAGIVHVTSSAFPAALSAAVHARAGGRALLGAYIVGVEANARLGAVAKGAFHQVGFHPTGTTGAFAAALIAGRLFGLNAAQLAEAQGIILTTASGSMEFLEDGAWIKRLNPGWAAASGMTAAALAAQGFIGATAVYEGRFGLYKSHLGMLEADCDYSLATAGLGDVWETGVVSIKPYPACHFTHGCIDAAIEVMRAADIAPDDIEHVTALVPEQVIKTVCEPVANKRRPKNGYDAQFSIPYLVANALRHGRFGLADLESGPLNDPRTLALADRIDYAADPDSGFPKYYSGEVVIHTRDGREFRHREGHNRGCVDRPIGNDGIIAKFRENAARAVSDQRAERILDLIETLDEHDSAAEIAAGLGG